MVWHTCQGISSIDQWIWGKGIKRLNYFLDVRTAATYIFVGLDMFDNTAVASGCRGDIVGAADGGTGG